MESRLKSEVYVVSDSDTVVFENEQLEVEEGLSFCPILDEMNLEFSHEDGYTSYEFVIDFCLWR